MSKSGGMRGFALLCAAGAVWAGAARAQHIDISTATSVGAAPTAAEGRFLPPGDDATSGIVDLVLIYQGGSHRPVWNAEDFRPYVGWTDPETSRTEWLFDGFLFLEIFDRAKNWEFADGYKFRPATRVEWTAYLDYVFAPDRGFAALDRAVADLAARIGPPPRPRRVVIMIPEPILDQTNWGEADGRALDFRRADDRVAACRWYLGELETRWRREAFRHIELAGFYWLAEHTKGRGEDIIPGAARAVHERGLGFFSIPYWEARGATQWRDLGFDAAYQQPNHFFHPEVADSRLDAAAERARRFGMGLEMEFDGRAISQRDTFAPRLAAYLNAFERHGAFKEAAIAHYEGGGAFGELARAEDPLLRALCVRYCRLIAARQKP